MPFLEAVNPIFISFSWGGIKGGPEEGLNQNESKADLKMQTQKVSCQPPRTLLNPGCPAALAYLTRAGSGRALLLNKLPRELGIPKKVWGLPVECACILSHISA